MATVMLTRILLQLVGRILGLGRQDGMPAAGLLGFTKAHDGLKSNAIKRLH